MTTLRAGLVALALVAIASLPAAADPVIADVQIVQTGARAWVVRIRASEGQAFDVEPGVPFTVHLHRASLSAERAPIGAVPFGTLAMAPHAEGVDVRVTLAGESLRVKAEQGESADVVLLTVTAAP